MSKRRLGRGLDALLSGPDDTAAPPESGIAEIALDQIVRGRYQPRRIFTEESLNELAASIRAQGLMQPIVVRPRPQGGYELIAGERRWRAARIAGLDQIPAIVREVADDRASAMALIENIQREDLNPMEEAKSLNRLIREFDLDFVITSERSIGSGLRRIEALTGATADEYLRQQSRTLEASAEAAGAQDAHTVPQRIAALQAELKEAKRRAKAGGSARIDLAALAAQATKQGALSVLVAMLDVEDDEALKEAAMNIPSEKLWTESPRRMEAHS